MAISKKGIPDRDGPVGVRVAPSPTGEPHVGTAYIALFDYGLRHSRGGHFILRIEDTDQVRSTKESEVSIIDTLKWLGLNWDHGPGVEGPAGPYRQSERSEIYREHAEMLLASGKAYRCFCTKERLDELRAAQREANESSRYDRHCRDLDPAEVEKQLAAGTPFVIRLKMPLEGATIVPDYLRGEVNYQNDQLDDQVLIKSDGYPTYHLANVVDDHMMGVTHVIRAEEWLHSTPKHIVMYEAFGWEPPVWVHMPLLRNKDRSKISKRKNPVSLRYYHDRGFLPEAMLNYLALSGWSFPEKDRDFFTLDEFVANFDLDRVNLGGPVFDLDRLEWMNGNYIRKLEADDLLARLVDLGQVAAGDGRAKALLPLLQERMTVLTDWNHLSDFLAERPFLNRIEERLVSRASLDDLRAALIDLRGEWERNCPDWNLSQLEDAWEGMDEEKRLLTTTVLDMAAEGAVDLLVLRGRGLVLKAFSEATDTLKKLVPKKQSCAEVAAICRDLAERLAGVESWTAEPLEECMRAYGEEKELKPGAFFMPVRIAALGKSATPGLFESLELVGKAASLDRLGRFAAVMDRLA